MSVTIARGLRYTVKAETALVLLIAIVFCLPEALKCQEVPTWHLERVFAIPRRDDHDTALSQIVAMAQSPSGDLFVCQYGTGAISVFNRSGIPLKSVGRTGAGPGEFRLVGSLGFVGDSLWAADVGLRRLTVFDGNLTVGRTEEATTTPGESLMLRFLMRNGHVVATPAQGALFTGSRRLPVYLSKDQKTWTKVAKLFEVDPRITLHLGGDQVAITGSPVDRSALLVAAPRGHGFVIVDPPAADTTLADAVRITRFDSAGDSIGSRVVPVRAQVANHAVREALVEELATRLKTLPMSMAAIRRKVDDALVIPAKLPR